MSNVLIPAVYVLSRLYPPEMADSVLRVLGMTPIYCTLVHSVYDYELARAFGEQIVRTDSEQDSIKLGLEWAEQTGMPCLVIGTAERLDAVFANGNRESVSI